MHIGPNIKVKGCVKFQRLLRIDGYVEGDLTSSSPEVVRYIHCKKRNIDCQDPNSGGFYYMM